MTKTVAPTACRYFGTKRIQSSSPAPMTKMAMSRKTRLRLSPKKSARDFNVSMSEFCEIRLRYSSRCTDRRLRRLFNHEQRARLGAARFLCNRSDINEQSQAGLGLASGRH